MPLLTTHVPHSATFTCRIAQSPGACGGPLYRSATLKSWLTMQSEFNFILADKLRSADNKKFPKLVTLQAIKESYPDWVVKRNLAFDKAFVGEYAAEYLAVSHRWESSGEPDTTGTQLAELRRFLDANKQIKYVPHGPISHC